MKKAILSSLMLSSGALTLLKSRGVHAEDTDDILLFCINAPRAWDPTSFCDPITKRGFYRGYDAMNKFNSYLSEGTPNTYNPLDINAGMGGDIEGNTQEGRFVWHQDTESDQPYDVKTYTRDHVDDNGSNSFKVAPFTNTSKACIGPYQVGPSGDIDFFEYYRNDLHVFNGVNTKSNAHPVGQRQAWSGRIRVGAPNIAALWGAIKELENGDGTYPKPFPMTFGSNSTGYEFTSDLVSITRAGNSDALMNLTDVYVKSASTGDTSPIVASLFVDRMKNYEQDKAARLMASGLPPHVKDNLERLEKAQLAEPDFKPLADSLEMILAPYDDSAELEQARILVAAMKAGICKSAFLGAGDFDSHSNHYENSNSSASNHCDNLQRLFRLTHYVRQALEAAGIWDRSIIMMASDFGRTRLNGDSRGKDHAPVTSTMLMGGENTGIGPGKSFGYSYISDIHPEGVLKTPKYVYAGNILVQNDGSITNSYDLDNGFNLTPAHIHHAVRKILGISDHPLAVAYELSSDFTPEFEDLAFPFFAGS